MTNISPAIDSDQLLKEEIEKLLKEIVLGWAPVKILGTDAVRELASGLLIKNGMIAMKENVYVMANSNTEDGYRVWLVKFGPVTDEDMKKQYVLQMTQLLGCKEYELSARAISPTEYRLSALGAECRHILESGSPAEKEDVFDFILHNEPSPEERYLNIVSERVNRKDVERPETDVERWDRLNREGHGWAEIAKMENGTKSTKILRAAQSQIKNAVDRYRKKSK